MRLFYSKLRFLYKDTVIRKVLTLRTGQIDDFFCDFPRGLLIGHPNCHPSRLRYGHMRLDCVYCFFCFQFSNSINYVIEFLLSSISVLHDLLAHVSFFQPSPFCKVVREVLVELELPHILHRYMLRRNV